jgi:hypothetical protein
MLISMASYGQANSGNIVAFEKNGVFGAYVFEAQGTKLYAKFLTGSSPPPNWEAHGAPPQRVGSIVGPMGKPTPISYSTPVKIGQPSGERLEVFVVQNGQLYSRYWDGTDWSWTNLGAPVAKVLKNEPPGVTTYVLSNLSTRRTHAFVVDTDGDLHEWTRTGTQAQWSAHGHPTPIPNTDPAGWRMPWSPTVVSYAEGDTRRILAFTNLQNHRFYMLYSTGNTYAWANRGDEGDNHASAITYSAAGLQRVYAFVRQVNFTPDIVVNYFNGFTWQWADQGEPFGNAGVPHAITLSEGGVRKIFVFTEASDKQGHTPPDLWSNVWDGSAWTWTQHSFGDIDIAGVTGAVTYNVQGVRKYVVVVRTGNADVWQNRYANGAWSWSNLGHP